MTIKTAAEIFRDYEVDGNPSSQPHKPIKADIREFLTALASTAFPDVSDSIVTGAGPFTIAATQSFLILNKAAPSATSVVLGSVADRSNLKLTIIDYKGNAGDITITPNGTEKIMGLSSWTVASSGGNGFGGKIELIPSEDLNGWLVAVG